MDIANFSLEILAFLFLIGVLAGFLDTLVGGGGLLAVPALLLSGIPPIYVLGTNKFQGSMGTGIATFLLFRKKFICRVPNTKLFRWPNSTVLVPINPHGTWLLCVVLRCRKHLHSVHFPPQNRRTLQSGSKFSRLRRCV